MTMKGADWRAEWERKIFPAAICVVIFLFGLALIEHEERYEEHGIPSGHEEVCVEWNWECRPTNLATPGFIDTCTKMPVNRTVEEVKAECDRFNTDKFMQENTCLEDCVCEMQSDSVMKIVTADKALFIVRVERGPCTAYMPMRRGG